jgi:hypothetical protein
MALLVFHFFNTFIDDFDLPVKPPDGDQGDHRADEEDVEKRNGHTTFFLGYHDVIGSVMQMLAPA